MTDTIGIHIGSQTQPSYTAWCGLNRTLPSNLALCVNPGFTYVRARDPKTGKVYVVAESRLPAVPGAVPKPGSKKGAAADKKKGKGGGGAETAAAVPAAEAAAEPQGWQVYMHAACCCACHAAHIPCSTLVCLLLLCRDADSEI